MPSLRRAAVVVASVAVLSGTTLTAAAPEVAVADGPGAPRPSGAGRSGTQSAPTHRQIAFSRWAPHSFDKGRFDHTRGAAPGLVISGGSRGRWYSPWVRERFALTELIASYTASTPVGSFIEISARGRTAGGRRSSWDDLGRWASHDRRFHRRSLGPQRDDLSRVAVDTLVTTTPRGFQAWQLRVALVRRSSSGRTPTVRTLGAVVSRLPPDTAATSRPHRQLGRDLDVPRFSQQIHAGEYPRWNGGGEAWCSPTSTSMVLAYWHRGPTRRQYAWVDDSYRQPWVDYAARYTYAWGYGGTGDWPFNTAYAARFGVDAFVTRLASLRQAELFIRAGIPLVASISFGPGELHGAPISSSAGHLLVIRGFTGRGRVVVNDPAAASSGSVRRVYRRGEFERAWVGSTGGVVYVIHPPGRRLPRAGPGSAW